MFEISQHFEHYMFSEYIYDENTTKIPPLKPVIKNCKNEIQIKNFIRNLN